MKNGGQAFPTPASHHAYANGDVMFQPVEGMTLRDYFAAKAMHAEVNTAGAVEEAAVALCKAAECAGRSIPDQIAHNAYMLADAMLKARES